MRRQKAATRHGERELAFQVLYSLSFSPVTEINALRRIFAESLKSMAQWRADTKQPAGAMTFAWKLVEGVWSTSPQLDAVITRFSHNWRVDRMGRVELTLLRLAVFELVFREDIPPKVAINEALELSRLFGEDKAKSFVNGILDAVAGALENGEVSRSTHISPTRLE